MSIAYSATGQAAGASSETSGAAVSPASPSTVNAGDILIVHAYFEGTATAPSTPSGFTLLDGPRVIETTIGRHWVYGKVADGTEDSATNALGTQAVTTMRSGRCYRFTGRVSGTITDLVRGFVATSHATDPQMPTVTTTITGGLAVALVAQNDNNAFASPTGESGGDWVEAVAEYTVALTPGLSLGLETCTPTANPGTVSGGSMATTNDPCGVIGFEIRPEVPSVTGTGALAAQVADITGTGVSSSTQTDGTISAQVATVAGSGLSTSLVTDGTIVSQNATLAGVGTVENSTITGTGVLLSQVAIVAGVGVSSSDVSDGGLIAQNSTMSGVGGSSSLIVDGDMFASASTMSGVGEVSGGEPPPVGYSEYYLRMRRRRILLVTRRPPRGRRLKFLPIDIGIEHVVFD